MAWQRKRKERKREEGGEREGKGGGIQSTRGKQENGEEHILKPMLIYLSSQIKQVHKGKTFSFSKGIPEVIFKLKI